MLFDLYDQHFLLIAGGTKLRVGSIGVHNARLATPTAVYLTGPTTPLAPAVTTPVLILIHASFMIVAWIGLTSIGIIFARHYKGVWTNERIFGQEVWLICHFTCMALSLLLTIAGVIVIFAEFGEWRHSVHAILGLTVLACVVLQALGGILKPKPGSDNRPVFNSLHLFLGNVTHLLAIITIFFAIPLAAVGLPGWTTYIVIGFVVIYLITNVKLDVRRAEVFLKKCFKTFFFPGDTNIW